MALARSNSAVNSVTMTEEDKAPPSPKQGALLLAQSGLWLNRGRSMPGERAGRQQGRDFSSNEVPSRPAIKRKLPKEIGYASITHLKPDWLK